MANIRGFFKEETETVSTGRKPRALLSEEKPNCIKCKLDQTCKHPRMQMTGKGRKGIFIIGEAPGAEEDDCGKQLVGEAGKLLRSCLKKLEIELDNDCFKINSVNCRPPDNREPTDKELRYCFPMIDSAIKKTNPKIIILFGNKALQTFFYGKAEKKILTISNWTRHCVPSKEYNAWIIPCFHPAMLLHNKENSNSKDDVLKAVFEADLKFAVSCLDLEPPEFEEPSTKNIKVLYQVDEVISALKEVKKSRKMFVDYETSGLKPYSDGHKVYSIAIAGEKTPVYSLPFQYVHWKNKEFELVKKEFCKLLQNENIGKIAQNLKFENKWSIHVVKSRPANWEWDTMNTQHLIDVRRGMTKLETQALVYYGQGDWGKEISVYKKNVGKTGFNSMHKAPLDKLLWYGGMDIFYTRKRYYDQKEFMRKNKKIAECNKLFFEGTLALADVEENGICVNEKYYREKVEEITKELVNQETLLKNRGAGLQFKKKYGREVDIQSAKDLRILFYQILKLDSLKKTKKNFESVDAYTLSNLNVPFAKALIRFRKTKKMYDYVAEYDRISFNGKIYPSIDLNMAATGRSNSSDPNLQNVPVRDEESRDSVRGGIIPSPGNRIAEIDYSQIEVRIMACYSKDPVLISYIMDKSKDMHRDIAMKIFRLPAKEITKPIRHIGKNDFVFPQFYGDYYLPCAKSAYEDCADLKIASGISILEHLKSVGIGTYDKFVKNMEIVEDDFWKMLKVTKQWRDDVVKEYKRKTMVETFFGFRRNGYIVKNQITNTPVQGTAFHCLLWSLIRINKWLKENNMKTKVIGEVHDSILLDVNPKEQDEVLKHSKHIMTKMIEKEHDWLIVPLEVEIEMTEIDGCWSLKKTFKES